MKRNILWTIAAAILFSCTDSMQEYAAMDDFNNNVQTESDRSHFVSKSDIAALLRAQSNSTRSVSECEDDITCFVDEKYDTLLYACNKAGGGWIVYASDTRVPAIVAESSAGTFGEAMQNKAAQMWMESIAEEMKVIKSLPDEKLNFSADEIEKNKDFWFAIGNPDKFVKMKLGINDSIGQKGLPMATGHYEFSGTYDTIEYYDSIPRLTTTNWHQDASYNLYCPYQSNSSILNAPAGCVAIAGAQMLYFLHNKFGVPTTAPSEAYVYGHVGDSNYNWDQYNYTSAIWSTMANSPGYAAPLIANVGKRVGMNYGDDGSSAYTSDLVNGVFAPYGISCTYTSYNTTNLRSSLIQGIPVIVCAQAMDGQEMTAHSFIIDRYRRYRTLTQYCFVWVWDTTPPGVPLIEHPNQYEYVYSSPYINMIGMNWGWGSYFNNGEWYTLTGDWINHSTTACLNWNISRNMIYNFQVIGN